MEIYLCRGYAFNSSADFETIRELKEKFCFVSCDIKGDRKLDGETTYYNSYYKLPDGRQVKISNEKFEAPEILFSPYLVNSESDGIHELDCPIDTRKKLYSSIVISGANTMFPGFSSRLESEVKNLYKERILKNSGGEIKINLNIVDTPRRKYSVFLGACFLANFYGQHEGYWISKQEWEEIGPSIIHKKCQNLMI